MDAFEHLVASALALDGFWTRTSYKVELSKEDKRVIGRPSSPRWEIDVIAYKPAENRLLAIECKSYLDSHGVKWRDFADLPTPSKSRYKLFNERVVREVVLSNLKNQLIREGLCVGEPSVQLALAAANFATDDDRDEVRALFQERGWWLYDEEWLRTYLSALAQTGYTNDIEAVVAKLLLR